MSDTRETLEALERLMATEGWQMLVAEMQAKQLSISRQLIGADDVKDYIGYRELAAQHRQIGVIILWPAAKAERLRRDLAKEPEGE
jgi:hypothetical protein